MFLPSSHDKPWFHGKEGEICKPHLEESFYHSVQKQTMFMEMSNSVVCVEWRVCPYGPDNARAHRGRCRLTTELVGGLRAHTGFQYPRFSINLCCFFKCLQSLTVLKCQCVCCWCSVVGLEVTHTWSWNADSENCGWGPGATLTSLRLRRRCQEGILEVEAPF